MDERRLILEALEARNLAYAPYSHFLVGAALLGKSGRVYRGCNVENASYGATNCVERTAFFKGVSEGEVEFMAIAIAGGPEGRAVGLCPPCGVCRQVMAEFCPGDFPVLLASSADTWETYTLDELLPRSFQISVAHRKGGEGDEML